MIWFYIVQAFHWLVRQITLPKPDQMAQVDVQAKCPVCGVIAKHPVRCVARTVTPRVDPIVQRGVAPSPPPTARHVFCQHTCSLCGARWLQAPIAKNADAMQSIPRDEIEKAEDYDAKLAASPPR